MVRFRLGETNLSEAERTRSEGACIVYYADEEDYRIRFFDTKLFWPSLMNGKTFGQLWEEGEPVEVDVAMVKRDFVPAFQLAMERARAADDEPPHLAYEVYWRGELIYQEEVPP